MTCFYVTLLSKRLANQLESNLYCSRGWVNPYFVKLLANTDFFFCLFCITKIGTSYKKPSFPLLGKRGREMKRFFLRKQFCTSYTNIPWKAILLSFLDAGCSPFLLSFISPFFLDLTQIGIDNCILSNHYYSLHR